MFSDIHILGNYKIYNNIQIVIQLSLGSKNKDKKYLVSNFYINYQI